MRHQLSSDYFQGYLGRHYCMITWKLKKKPEYLATKKLRHCLDSFRIQRHCSIQINLKDNYKVNITDKGGRLECTS